MRVQRVNNYSVNSKGYIINSNENKHVKYLYNEVQDTIKGQGITTTFARDFIKMDRLTEKVKNKLEELKVVFKKEK